nr:hypothetical protein [Oscillospiraceae bacterium]
MKKNRNKTKSSVVILLSPIILLILLLGIELALSIFPEVQRYQIRNEVFAYVQENKDSIDLHALNIRSILNIANGASLMLV